MKPSVPWMTAATLVGSWSFMSSSAERCSSRCSPTTPRMVSGFVRSGSPYFSRLEWATHLSSPSTSRRKFFSAASQSDLRMAATMARPGEAPAPGAPATVASPV